MGVKWWKKNTILNPLRTEGKILRTNVRKEKVHYRRIFTGRLLKTYVLWFLSVACAGKLEEDDSGGSRTVVCRYLTTVIRIARGDRISIKKNLKNEF